MKNKKAIISILVVVLLIFVLGTVLFMDQSRDRTDEAQSPSINSTTTPGSSSSRAAETEVIAENLSVPWDIAFLPNGDLLFTEREGNIKRLYLSADQHVEQIASISNVRQSGEGGLHGIALHPNFQENRYVYVYYTYAENGGNTLNRVVRYTYQDGNLSDDTIIIDEIPGALFHDGGRIRFGPDEYLYVATGDAQVPSLAQDRDALAGKILRVTDTGEPAPGNPFGTQIYSYGHRNPQGITWDEDGNLWITEHGPSSTGSDCCRDEINLITAGQNYGWPTITGDETQPGMEPPAFQSGPNTTWAPAGIAYINGSLLFGGLRGQALYEAVLDETTVTKVTAHFEERFGRIRAVVLGPDNNLYISTSNRDGRGTPHTGDDKIIRVNPERL